MSPITTYFRRASPRRGRTPRTATAASGSCVSEKWRVSRRSTGRTSLWPLLGSNSGTFDACQSGAGWWSFLSRQHEDILSVWTQDSKDDDAIAKIRDAIKTNLDLPTLNDPRLQAPRLPRSRRKGLGRQAQPRTRRPAAPWSRKDRGQRQHAGTIISRRRRPRSATGRAAPQVRTAPARRGPGFGLTPADFPLASMASVYRPEWNTRRVDGEGGVDPPGRRSRDRSTGVEILVF